MVKVLNRLIPGAAAVLQMRPGQGEVLLYVKAVGINFRDVLNVLGMYPGDPGAPGSDCAGVVMAKGGLLFCWLVFAPGINPQATHVHLHCRQLRRVDALCVTLNTCSGFECREQHWVQAQLRICCNASSSTSCCPSCDLQGRGVNIWWWARRCLVWHMAASALW
jgi:hypothetical protein